MKFLNSIICIVVFTASPASANPSPQSPEKSWGSKISLTEPITLDDAIKSMPIANEILVQGKAVQVCQKKGCWLTLKSSTSDIRVTFKGYKFFVPFSLKEQYVKVQGIIKEEVVSVSDQKHFLKDEGRPQADIDAITVPKKVPTIVASGVEKI